MKPHTKCMLLLPGNNFCSGLHTMSLALESLCGPEQQLSLLRIGWFDWFSSEVSRAAALSWEGLFVKTHLSCTLAVMVNLQGRGAVTTVHSAKLLSVGSQHQYNHMPLKIIFSLPRSWVMVQHLSRTKCLSQIKGNKTLKTFWTSTTLVDASVLEDLPIHPTIQDLVLPPTFEKVQSAVRLLNTGKGPGPDGIPAEILRQWSYVYSLYQVQGEQEHCGHGVHSNSKSSRTSS